MARTMADVVTVVQIGKCFGANPSPEGRGCREAAGEGYHKYFFNVFHFSTPHAGVLLLMSHPLP
jgi:hypothetical protein